jgi:hypothetical protein
VDSTVVVKALHEVDPGFVALCDTLFGKAVDPADVWEFMYTPQGVSKMTPGASDLHVPQALKAARGMLVPKPLSNGVPKPPGAKSAMPKKKAQGPSTMGVIKDESGVEVVWTGEFSKADPEKRQAFGWASVVEIGGVPIVDIQGDDITPEDIEKAAYVYVEKSRVGGTQHERDELDQPVQAGHLIESFVSTPEKIEKMGLPADFPVGWWVGFQYGDNETWQDIKSGRKTGFSIHGRGKRMPVDA